MVEIGGLKDQDHEVLGIEYCSGYTDNFGKWNTGFYCPTLGNGEQPVYCCGTLSQKYCCTKRDEDRIATPIIDQTTLLGIVLGCMMLVVLVTLASCILCRRCVMKRKRQHAAINGGPLYQMHCSSSSTSGVANMYTFGVGSGERSTPTTPLDNQLEMTVQRREGTRRADYVIDDDFSAISSFPNNNEDLTRVFRNLHMNCPLNHSEPPPPYREIHSIEPRAIAANGLLSRPNDVNNQSPHCDDVNHISHSVPASLRTSLRSQEQPIILNAARVPSSFRPINAVPGGGRERELRITHI